MEFKRTPKEREKAAKAAEKAAKKADEHADKIKSTGRNFLIAGSLLAVGGLGISGITFAQTHDWIASLTAACCVTPAALLSLSSTTSVGLTRHIAGGIGAKTDEVQNNVKAGRPIFRQRKAPTA